MGKKCKVHVFIILSVLSNYLSQAQDENEDLIQFSGIVVTADSLRPVPYTNIVIKNTWRGAVADYYGFFSFVAHKKDTLIFSSVGYKKGAFVIPDTIQNDRYSLIQVMSTDTILLTQTVIYPWPSREDFKEVFLEFDVPDDDYERARKNLNSEFLRDIASSIPMDGSMNYKYAMNQYQDKLYYIGQTQPISIFNVFAWAKFIQAWQDGKFKRKERN
jgi:hypothetical protein